MSYLLPVVIPPYTSLADLYQQAQADTRRMLQLHCEEMLGTVAGEPPRNPTSPEDFTRWILSPSTSTFEEWCAEGTGWPGSYASGGAVAITDGGYGRNP